MVEDNSCGNLHEQSSSSSSSSSSIPWAEKYRPKSLEDVVGNNDVIATIARMAASKQCPNLLVFGPSGAGKTSSMKAAARTMHGGEENSRHCTMELNASDDRKIQMVRDSIKIFTSSCLTRPHTNSQQQQHPPPPRLVMLDEADAMRNEAQFALRAIIEQFSNHTRFIIICNQVTKIVPSIQSRCKMIRFGPLSPSDIRKRLVFVAESEGVAQWIDDSAYDAIETLVDGDLRKALNTLQAACSSVQIPPQQHDSSPTTVASLQQVDVDDDDDEDDDDIFTHTFASACPTSDASLQQDDDDDDEDIFSHTSAAADCVSSTAPGLNVNNDDDDEDIFIQTSSTAAAAASPPHHHHQPLCLEKAMTTNKINDEIVYECAGQPSPRLLRKIIACLLKTQKTTLYDTYSFVAQECEAGGFALLDIVRGIFRIFMSELCESAQQQHEQQRKVKKRKGKKTMMMLRKLHPCESTFITKLAQLESHLHGSSTETTQILGLVCIFGVYVHDKMEK